MQVRFEELVRIEELVYLEHLPVDSKDGVTQKVSSKNLKGKESNYGGTCNRVLVV